MKAAPQAGASTWYGDPGEVFVVWDTAEDGRRAGILLERPVEGPEGT